MVTESQEHIAQQWSTLESSKHLPSKLLRKGSLGWFRNHKPDTLSWLPNVDAEPVWWWGGGGDVLHFVQSRRELGTQQALRMLGGRGWMVGKCGEGERAVSPLALHLPYQHHIFSFWFTDQILSTIFPFFSADTSLVFLFLFVLSK